MMTDVELVRLAATRPAELDYLPGGPTRAWQRVNRAIDTPEVAAAAPMEAARLRRLRDRRRRAHRVEHRNFGHGRRGRPVSLCIGLASRH